MKNVLIIGSGKRIENNFIPALSCLNNQFNIIGVHSRSSANYERVAARWQIPPQAELTSSLIRRADLICISITPTNVVQVLNRLHALGYEGDLLLDTPVCELKSFSDGNVFKKFSRVYVAEDFARFTRFDLMQEFIATGEIGTVKTVQVDGLGFGYHGSALVRSFFGYQFPTAVKTSSLNGVDRFQLFFKRKCQGSFTHPYRPENGSLIIEGERGRLTMEVCDGRLVKPNLNANDFYLSQTGNSFEIKNAKDQTKLTLQMKYNSQLENISPKATSFNQEKTHGLISVFLGVNENQNKYFDFQQGIFDSFVDNMIRAPGWYWVPSQFSYTNSLAGWIIYRGFKAVNRLVKRFKFSKLLVPKRLEQ